jgi:molecular chaperone HscB
MDLTQNHFELFGLPVRYALDMQQLAERYRELQRALHPDRYANAGDRERRLSVQQAARINDAYQTLKSPLQRARYLLQLKGIEFDDERETHLDPEFLMEQMELREALGGIREQADPVTALNDFLQQLADRNKAMQARLQELLETDRPEAWQEAKQQVQKMQFLARLQQEAEGLEESLLDTI